MLRTPPGARSPQPPGGGRYQRLLFDGKRFFEEKDYETAFQVYQQALKLAPTGDHQALSQLCRCYRKKARQAYQKEDYAQVFKLLQEMMGLDKVSRHLKGLDYKVLTESALELGEFQAAEQALTQALNLDPELEDTLKPLQRRLKTERLHREMQDLY